MVAMQADWQQIICPGPLVNVPDGGPARLGGRVSGVAGANLASWLAPVAIVTAFLPALALLADRRARAAMLAVAALGALALMIGVFATPTPLVVNSATLGCRVATTPWRNIAFLGGVLALGGVGLAVKPATTLPKLGLPERPPSEVEP
jgi:hypothetical protein